MDRLNPALEDHLRAPHGLATLLTQARKRQTLKGDRFAEAVGTTRSLVSNYSRGKRIPPKETVELWATVCEVDPAPLLRALEMARQFEGSWSSRLAGGQRQHQETLAELQASTTLFRSASFDLVPGGLQTPEYATRILTQSVEFHGGVVSDDDIAGAVAARRRQQEAFLIEGRRFEFLIWEPVLRVRTVQPDRMAEQVRRVRELAQLSQVDIRVLPMDAEYPLFAHSTFICYDDQVVMLEPVPGPTAYDDDEAVEKFLAAFRLWFGSDEQPGPAVGGDDLDLLLGEIVDYWERLG